MAKRKSAEEPIEDVARETDVNKLTKELIRAFNGKSTEKVAWNLATDVDNPTDVKSFISTGSTILDYLICNRPNGGVPEGKLTEISGEEASGKSLLCAHIIANTQKAGGIAIYIDTENAAHPAFMRQVGVDLNKMVYLQPGTIESVFDHIDKTIAMARAKDVKKPVTIIWDSVAATPPQAEVDGTYDPTSQIGLMARTISKGMRKLTDTVGKERITLVFTNQLKTKIGVMYGDPLTTPGGKAIPYHASVRIRLTSSTKLKNVQDDDETGQDKGDVYGIRTLAKVVKSRLGPPLRRCEFEIHFDKGVDDEGSWLTCLHERGIISKSNGFMVMDYAGKEKRFRESRWKDELRDRAFRDFVLDVLNQSLVVRYDLKPIDQEIDPESLMEVEAVADVIGEQKIVPPRPDVDDGLGVEVSV